MKAKLMLLQKSAMIQPAMKLACLAGAMSLLAAGCSTPKSSSAVSRTAFQLPAPHYSIYGIAMHRCYIVKTNTASAGTMMKVHVGGEVAHPGAIELPEGATVLEAIAAAGGFCEFSSIYHIELMMGHTRYSPKLHIQKTAFHTRQAWYGDGEGDLVLEPEASIFVPRRVSLY